MVQLCRQAVYDGRPDDGVGSVEPITALFFDLGLPLGFAAAQVSSEVVQPLFVRGNCQKASKPESPANCVRAVQSQFRCDLLKVPAVVQQALKLVDDLRQAGLDVAAHTVPCEVDQVAVLARLLGDLLAPFFPGVEQSLSLRFRHLGHALLVKPAKFFPGEAAAGMALIFQDFVEPLDDRAPADHTADVAESLAMTVALIAEAH